MEKNNKENNFVDVTEKWLQESKPNSHIIEYDKTYVDINGVLYPKKIWR